MSLNTAQLEYLAAKGLTLEEVVALSRLGDVRSDPTAAERKARQRAREKEAVRLSQRDVTRDKVSLEVPPQTPLPKTLQTISPLSPTGTSPHDFEPSIQSLVEEWNEMAAETGLSRVEKLTNKRRRACQSRIRTDGVDEIRRAIERIRGSPFLLGQRRDWRASFDFLMKPDSVTKINEGKYDKTSYNGQGWPTSDGGRPSGWRC